MLCQKAIGIKRYKKYILLSCLNNFTVTIANHNHNREKSQFKINKITLITIKTLFPSNNEQAIIINFVIPKAVIIIGIIDVIITNMTNNFFFFICKKLLLQKINKYLYIYLL